MQCPCTAAVVSVGGANFGGSASDGATVYLGSAPCASTVFISWQSVRVGGVAVEFEQVIKCFACSWSAGCRQGRARVLPSQSKSVGKPATTRR